MHTLYTCSQAGLIPISSLYVFTNVLIHYALTGMGNIIESIGVSNMLKREKMIIFIIILRTYLYSQYGE